MEKPAAENKKHANSSKQKKRSKKSQKGGLQQQDGHNIKKKESNEKKVGSVHQGKVTSKKIDALVNEPVKRGNNDKDGNDKMNVQGNSSANEHNGGKEANVIGPIIRRNNGGPNDNKRQMPFHFNMNQEEFQESLKQYNIINLDEPQETRKYGEYSYYCTTCECILRNGYHIRDHVLTGEHFAKANRHDDRKRLQSDFADMKTKFGCPTRQQITALDFLSASIQNNSDLIQDEFVQKRDIQQILAAFDKTLHDAFGAHIGEGEKVAELQITGSFLTGLHLARENTCDLNIFAKFHQNLEKPGKLGYLFIECFEAIKKICRYLPKSTPLSPARMHVHYGAPTIRIQLFFDQFAYYVTFGMGPLAENAHCSTRLVLAYLHIWPPLRRLIRFVRIWAETNFLTFDACAGITNYAFDILSIFYLQRTGYLPVLNEFIEELLATEESTSPLPSSVRSIDQLCRLPEPQFANSCRQFRKLFYGERIPLISDGEMVHGFFKYFATEFDLRNLCCIKSHQLIEKRYGEKHFMVMDPFIERCNILHLRLEGDAYFWNCIIKSAAYLCVPQTLEGPLMNIEFDKSEFEMKKTKISFLRIKTLALKWNLRVEKLINSANCTIDYSFDRINFQPGQIPQIICQHCNQPGHCDWDCHTVRPCSSSGLIHPIRANLRNDLTNAIKRMHREKTLTKERVAKIEEYIVKLKAILRETLAVDDLTLTPFGSVVNGFGMNDCDLDLCLQSAQINQIHTTQEIIEKIDEKLHKLGYKTQPIILAKVPIVKFQDPDKEFRGDISIGNCLGLKNSNLLKTYTKFDSRVAPLGLFIKRLFKLHNLNDSPNGSFSSYSLTILLIAYLQRGCKPPILPYLQELTKDENPREMLEGWDVTFAQSPTRECLPELNKQTMADLFIGFLHYYSGEFDPKMDVVQIRRPEPLLKMDKANDTKRWDQYTFCCEDPFDLNHNLCGGIKRDVLHQFYSLLRSTLRGLALLDTKREKWTVPENGQGALEALMKHICSEGNGNRLSIVSKLLFEIL